MCTVIIFTETKDVIFNCLIDCSFLQTLFKKLLLTVILHTSEYLLKHNYHKNNVEGGSYDSGNVALVWLSWRYIEICICGDIYACMYAVDSMTSIYYTFINIYHYVICQL